MTSVLFLGDSPDLPSGLGRIGRGLAARLAAHPDFRVSYLGLGGIGSLHAPFPTYTIQGHAWGAQCFEAVCQDFFKGALRKIVFTIWDLGRLGWLPRAAAGIELWGYHPIDGEAPNGGLLRAHRETLAGYSRVVAYSEFAARLISGGAADAAAAANRAGGVPVIGHGVEAAVFHRRSKPSRFLPGGITVGCVATNQARKDWGTYWEACALLHKRHADWYFWGHLDRARNPEGWCMPELVESFGIPSARVRLTTSLSDEELAEMYSQVAVVVDPAPEGWGFPQAEAPMCGTPSLGVDYGAGPEVAWAVVPVEHYRWQDCVKRPVLDPGVLAERIEELIACGATPDTLRLWAQERYSWEKVWPQWVKWFEEGL